MSKYLEFIEKEKKPKTVVIHVWSKYSNCVLGIIKWYPQWRHYCFFPNNMVEVVYSDRCLMEINDYITNLNEAMLKKVVK